MTDTAPDFHATGRPALMRQDALRQLEFGGDARAAASRKGSAVVAARI